MLGGLWKLSKKIIGIFIILVVLYIIALMFDMLPDDYTPRKLFPTQYKNFKDKLAADAAANDSTSNFSKHLNSYLDSLEKSEDATANPKPAAQAADDATQGKPVTPIDKAKAAVQDYNNAEKKEQQQLNGY